MFNSISWQTYLQIVAVGSGIYYCAVIQLFFRKEARSILGKVLSQKRSRLVNDTSQTVSHTEILQSKLDELRVIFTTAGYGTSKQVLQAAIQNSLASYDGLHMSLHRDAIALFISTQAHKICGLDLSDQEIKESIPTTGQ